MIRILGSALFALSFGLYAQPAYLPLESSHLEKAIAEQFAGKGQAVVEANLRAFAAGKAGRP